MVNWKVTATTVYCNAVDTNVAIMVYKDWSTKCAGYGKYGKGLSKDRARTLKRKGQKPDRILKCEGPECPCVKAFRDQLLDEE